MGGHLIPPVYDDYIKSQTNLTFTKVRFVYFLDFITSSYFRSQMRFQSKFVKDTALQENSSIHFIFSTEYHGTYTE